MPSHSSRFQPKAGGEPYDVIPQNFPDQGLNPMKTRKHPPTPHPTPLLTRWFAVQNRILTTMIIFRALPPFGRRLLFIKIARATKSDSFVMPKVPYHEFSVGKQDRVLRNVCRSIRKHTQALISHGILKMPSVESHWFDPPPLCTSRALTKGSSKWRARHLTCSTPPRRFFGPSQTPFPHWESRIRSVIFKNFAPAASQNIVFTL